MINYKKADAYFAKQIKRNEIRIWQVPVEDGGGTWVADKHLAIYYHDQPLPFDPASAINTPALARIVKNAAGDVDPVESTPFLLENVKKHYRVFKGQKLLDKDFAAVLGTDLSYHGSDRGLSLFVVKNECGSPLGFACEFKADKAIWEELKNDASN